MNGKELMLKSNNQRIYDNVIAAQKMREAQKTTLFKFPAIKPPELTYPKSHPFYNKTDADSISNTDDIIILDKELPECQPDICKTFYDEFPDFFEKEWDDNSYEHIETKALEYLRQMASQDNSNDKKCIIPFVYLINIDYKEMLTDLYKQVSQRPGLSCIFLLTYAKDYPDTIYYPTSSWNTGRNLLLYLMLMIEIKLNIMFDYFIFGDGDIIELPICVKSGERWHAEQLFTPSYENLIQLYKTSLTDSKIDETIRLCICDKFSEEVKGIWEDEMVHLSEKFFQYVRSETNNTKLWGPVIHENSGVVVANCHYVDILFCEWLCNAYSDNCENWHTIQHSKKEATCSLIPKQKSDERKIISDYGYVRSSDHCQETLDFFTDSLKYQVEIPLLERRPAVGIPS
eukprot:UN24842